MTATATLPNAMAIPVRDPRSGAIDTHITPPTARELSALVARVRAAQPAWLAIGVEGRAAAMREWGAALARHRVALTNALEHDTGRRAISTLEIDLVLAAITRWSAQAPELLRQHDVSSSLPFVRIQSAIAPFPLVGIISPWNFPLLLATLDTSRHCSRAVR